MAEWREGAARCRSCSASKPDVDFRRTSDVGCSDFALSGGHTAARALARVEPRLRRRSKRRAPLGVRGRTGSSSASARTVAGRSRGRGVTLGPARSGVGSACVSEAAGPNGGHTRGEGAAEGGAPAAAQEGRGVSELPEAKSPHRSEGFAWAPTIVGQEKLTDALELDRRLFQHGEDCLPLRTCQADDLRLEQKSRLEFPSQRPTNDRDEFANDPVPNFDSTHNTGTNLSVVAPVTELHEAHRGRGSFVRAALPPTARDLESPPSPARESARERRPRSVVRLVVRDLFGRDRYFGASIDARDLRRELCKRGPDGLEDPSQVIVSPSAGSFSPV